ncbi:MAG: phosphoglycerate dehydrogenase [Chthonomonadales bacterium]|nr:phosphoglycerate dehydrogenase [Chthonomonadales bacterium]
MVRVLVADPIARDGVEVLRNGADVDIKTGLTPQELAVIIGDYDALVVRSETKVTEEVLAAGVKLQVVARAGVGIDNVDVAAATARGVLVVNSPHGNTTAAAELTVALMLALARRIPQADAALRSGRWDRKRFVGTEVYGKTLGIIGLGKIGAEVAKRARAMGMEVLAYDPFAAQSMAAQAGVQLRDLPSILSDSDFISLHTPLTDQTRGMIGAPEIAKMRDGVRIINCARGGLIDEVALAEAIQGGKVAGAALDVYAAEPVDPANPLLALDENVVTPHLGASTAEAQVAVSVDVALQVLDVLEGRPARCPVNMPHLTAEVYAALMPYLGLGHRMGSLIGQLARTDTGNGCPMDAVEVRYSGDFGDRPTTPITRSILAGLMTPVLSEPANMINALTLASARGIHVSEMSTPSREEYSTLVSVTLRSGERTWSVSGTAYGPNLLRIIDLNGYEVTFSPAGTLLITMHEDRPGMIGHIGTLIGQHRVNIGGMDLGRKHEGGLALMVMSVDDPIGEALLTQIRDLDSIRAAHVVVLAPAGESATNGIQSAKLAGAGLT